MSLILDSTPFFIPIILRFDFIDVLFQKVFEFNIFFDLCINFFCFQCLTFSCIQLVRLASEIPVQLPKFSLPDFSQFGLSLLTVLLLSATEMFYLFPSNFACTFVDFFEGFINFCFKDLYHIHKGCSKVFSSVSALVGLLSSSRDTLSCLLLIVVLFSGI